MGLPVWHELDLDRLEIVHFGWKQGDPLALEKLATSVRRHGQLRPIIARRSSEAGKWEIVDGRQLWRAMLKVGLTRGMVLDLGFLDVYGAQRVALDLELRFPTDYATLAFAVAGLLEQGASAEALAGASPWTAERLAYMAQLATWDWSLFRPSTTGQVALAWDAEDPVQAPVAAPEPEIAPRKALEAFPRPSPAPVPVPEPVQMAEPLEPEVPVPVPGEVVLPVPGPVDDGQLGLF